MIVVREVLDFLQSSQFDKKLIANVFASIFMVGWISYRRLGWLIGALLTLGLCLLPGVVISSMGILSENLYLILVFAGFIHLFVH
jgi:hypothetical protein